MVSRSEPSRNTRSWTWGAPLSDSCIPPLDTITSPPNRGNGPATDSGLRDQRPLRGPSDVVRLTDGGVIDSAAEHRVTVNSFLADGGDNFAVLVDGTDRLGGEVDLDALVTWFGANSPVAPGPQDRITIIN